MKMYLLALVAVFTTAVAFAVPPTLYLKNQFGEQSNNRVVGGNFISSPCATHTILANLAGTTVAPTCATYSAVSAILLPTQLLTGFTSGAGTLAGTDTVLQGIQKLSGNIQNKTVLANVLTGYSAAAGVCTSADTVLGCLQKHGGNVAAHQANSVAADVAALVVDFNALLAKLQAANLMAP